MIQEETLKPYVEQPVEACTEAHFESEHQSEKRLPKTDKVCGKEEVRHVLLGSPEAIRQTMHQLHALNYVESLLWSPITTVGDDLTMTKEQGEAMSLLRRPV